jgi:hypothetical protein
MQQLISYIHLTALVWSNQLQPLGCSNPFNNPEQLLANSIDDSGGISFSTKIVRSRNRYNTKKKKS